MSDGQLAARRITFADVKQFFIKLGGLLSRGICIVDDIPLLLLKETGKVGPFLLAGAGFIIFPVQGVIAIFDLLEALDNYKKENNRREFYAKLTAALTKMGLALLGLLVSSALLAFILVNLAILEAVASVAIPTIMTVISGVELIDAIGDYRRAKQAYELDVSPENLKKLDDAKRDVAFNTGYFGLGLAITAMATLGVLTGLGVLTLGFVPAAVLISVVVLALAIKIFEIVDEKKDNRFTNAIKNAWRKCFSTNKPAQMQTAEYRPLKKDMPDINRELAKGSTPGPATPVKEADEGQTSPRTLVSKIAPAEANTPESPQDLNSSFRLD